MHVVCNSILIGSSLGIRVDLFIQLYPFGQHLTVDHGSGSFASGFAYAAGTRTMGIMGRAGLIYFKK